MDGSAGSLLRYRKSIAAENIGIFCDIKKKHCSHFVTNDVDIIQTAKAAKFFLTDGVIVTGTETGDQTDPRDVESIVKNTSDLPVLVGSGVNEENVGQYASAHGIIVGSDFKRNGYWENEIDVERVKRFLEAVDKVRKCK